MSRTQEFSHIPIVDVRDLIAGAPGKAAIARQLGQACRESGFFYVVNHGVDADLQLHLQEQSRQFFALAPETKLRIRMALGGRAWRGYFRVGDELTSGKPDQKEGLYFGEELPAEHPLLKAGTPLHGPNLFPVELPSMRETVLEYMAALTQLGHRLMAGLALSLDLKESYFAEHCTGEPLTLFRIFSYPPPQDPTLWGVSGHLRRLSVEQGGQGFPAVAADLVMKPPKSLSTRASHKLVIQADAEVTLYSQPRPKIAMKTPAGLPGR